MSTHTLATTLTPLTLLSNLTTIVVGIDYKSMFDVFKITNSMTRQKILRLYFSNLEKKYYLRELERLLDLPVANIRRELISLEKAGFFTHEKVGNLVFYALNPKSPLFTELKQIIFKTIGVEGALKQAFARFKGIHRAFIFGSFAQNKERSSSDIDLMIIGTVDEDKLVKTISKLETELRREINYHLFSVKEWSEKAKTDSFIQSIVHNSTIEIV